jgi:hypothetical protein
MAKEYRVRLALVLKFILIVALVVLAEEGSLSLLGEEAATHGVVVRAALGALVVGLLVVLVVVGRGKLGDLLGI